MPPVAKEPLFAIQILRAASTLIRFEHIDVLVQNHREYASVLLATESRWRVIGEVLRWTGRACEYSSEFAPKSLVT